MIKETDNGQKQYCPECQEWADKYQRLIAENDELKQAFEYVREIAYTTDFDIADIQEICNEVLK
jgi:hypothetical protein